MVQHCWTAARACNSHLTVLVATRTLGVLAAKSVAKVPAAEAMQGQAVIARRRHIQISNLPRASPCQVWLRP
jgi:hypothetical protein